MSFPAQLMLVAAMNPTPEGKMPGESRSSPREIQNYLGRISGPLLDRIDLHLEVPQVKFHERVLGIEYILFFTVQDALKSSPQKVLEPGNPQKTRECLLLSLPH